MKRTTLRAALVTLGIVVLPLSIAHSANAAVIANQAKAPSISNPDLILAGTCWRRFGPYATQSTAWRYVRLARSKGYQTSGVWGEGGSIAYSYRSRGYYFKVFYRC
jgi:hypothetical protein